MEMVGGARLAQVFGNNQTELLNEWITKQHAIASRRGLVGEAELRNQFSQFVSLLLTVLSASDRVDFKGTEWHEVRAFLADMSAQRARQGFSPVETAMFVFSLKQPLVTRLRAALANEPAMLADLTWTISALFDELGL